MEENEEEDVDNEWDAETFYSENYNNHTVSYRAEIEEYGDEVAVIRNRVGDSVGIVQIDDDEEDELAWSDLTTGNEKLIDKANDLLGTRLD
mgnify:CR=1 FL=1